MDFQNVPNIGNERVDGHEITQKSKDERITELESLLNTSKARVNELERNKISLQNNLKKQPELLNQIKNLKDGEKSRDDQLAKLKLNAEEDQNKISKLKQENEQFKTA